MKKINSALISVYHKEELEPIVKKLHELGVVIYSTGGTEKFITDLGIPVTPVQDITAYPSILGGRVKTLHPKIFGGILNRPDSETDKKELIQYNIPSIDAIIVDLYPFEKTVANEASEQEIIEKIDIGGISLIRAAAKNFKKVICVPSIEDYPLFLDIITKNNGSTSLQDRKKFATKSFHISSHYDTAIFNYFNTPKEVNAYKISAINGNKLRYGENPHQEGCFFGDLDSIFDKLHGKDLSYNNLLDIDAAVSLILEFKEEQPTFAILKHNNACGLATRPTLSEAYSAALEGDPISAFGGILISNRDIDLETAKKIHDLFCEVIIAPKYTSKSLELLKQKKNRIILVQKKMKLPKISIRSCLTGTLVQDRDATTDAIENLKYVTHKTPDAKALSDLIFASKICKHSKSNAIVLVKDKQLYASGVGQTSRVDALKQAIEKAKFFNFDLKGAVMASDAFFPFADCVEIASKMGINDVIQPGGSIKDQKSIDYCNENNISMVITGTRHFKH